MQNVAFEPLDRLTFERHFQRIRLAFLSAPVLVLIAEGTAALAYALVIAGGILLSFGVAWTLLRRWPTSIGRYQLGLRILDCVVAFGILAVGRRIYSVSDVDFAYLIVVVAAAATHGRLGALVLGAASGLAVLADRLAFVWAGAAFAIDTLTDPVVLAIFFSLTGSLVALLMRHSADTVAQREQQWRERWMRREADRLALEEYERLLDRLSDLAQAMGATRDRVNVFRILRDFVLSTTPSHAIFVTLYDPATQTRRCAYGHVDGSEVDVSGFPILPMTDGPNSRAIATGQVVICDDYQAATLRTPRVEVLSATDQRASRSALVAPMKMMGRTLGAFTAQSHELAAYSSEHATPLSMAANLAALALENLDHLERERELRVAAEASEQQHRVLAEQRKRLFELSQVAIATLSVDEVVKRVVEALRDVIPFSVGAVYWVDGAARLLRPAAVLGDDALVAPLRNWDIPLGVGIVGDVVRTGEGAFVDHAHRDPRSVYPPGVAVATEHYVCLPLRAKEGTFGVFVAARDADPPFSQDDYELMQLFVTHAAVAIENARLFEQARDHAQSEKLRALGQMAGGVAHDLNQSLALIAGYCDLALARLDQRPVDPASLRETLGIVAQAAMNGGRTVNGLLTFARGRPEGSPAPLDVGELLAEVVRLTAPRWRDAAQAEGRPIELTVSTEGNLTLMGWSASLQAALTNLIFNAVDAMPRGGSIRLDAHRRLGEIVVDLADTGVGMAPDVRRRVFEPFFSTKGEAGTGLGLAMVYGVVVQHAGRIDVSSAPGEGTIFRMVFPGLVDTRPSPQSTMRERSANGACTSLRVLVVDDEPQLTHVAALILGQHGHEVTTAATGEEALALFQGQPFDALVSDVSMGAGMNGWELARRARELRPETRVVLATGYGAGIDPEEARRRGVDVIVAKPYRAKTLRDAVGDCARREAVAAL